MRKSTSFLIGGLFVLTACQIYPPTPSADYTIRVTQDGQTAIPPECPLYATATTDPYDNEPLPQFGCANARNLALMVDRPDDLVRGRELGPTRSVSVIGAMRRYDNNQTRGLIDPSSSPDTSVAITTAPTGSSAMSGDAAGVGGGGGTGGGGIGGSGGGASSAASSAPAP
jgi:hypothetical protein